MRKVVCAFGGTGKSTLVKNDDRFVDMENSDYQWIYFEDIEDPELRKGSERVVNPEFPKNYIDAVRKAVDRGKYVLCGTKPEVLKALKSANIEFLLLVPDKRDKELYRQRFINRGNKPDWYEDYLAKWDSQVCGYEESDYNMLYMRRGTYLSDYVDIMVKYITEPLVILRGSTNTDEKWVEFNNEITDYLNSLLTESGRDLVKRLGRSYGVYILYDGEFVFRIPGCTLGGIEVDEKNRVVAFHFNEGFPLTAFALNDAYHLGVSTIRLFRGFKLEIPKVFPGGGQYE